jgi:hypothetical protein
MRPLPTGGSNKDQLESTFYCIIDERFDYGPISNSSIRELPDRSAFAKRNPALLPPLHSQLSLIFFGRQGTNMEQELFGKVIADADKGLYEPDFGGQEKAAVVSNSAASAVGPLIRV